MAYFFGDSFDLYAAPADATAGGTYWDSLPTPSGDVFVAGRFSGSQAIQIGTSVNNGLTKSSGSNDAIHHFVIAIYQTVAISGTSLQTYIELFDGATAQCSVVFRSDGAILLTSGGPGGSTLATYTGALTAQNTWYGFEIEVVVNSITGSFTVRKNGNTSNDFFLGSLNTRGSANNYANKILLGSAGAATTYVDDFLWRSDPSSVAWVGDIRCYVRRPASDVSVAWTPSGSIVPVTPQGTANTTSGFGINSTKYMPFVAPCSGTIGTAQLSVAGASTANSKAAIYTSVGGVPATPLATSNVVASPGVGAATFTFASPPSVTQGTQYWLSYDSDASSGTVNAWSVAPVPYSGALTGSTTYASFPATNPTALSATSTVLFTVNVTPSGVANAPLVAEPSQDGAASYVYSSTVSQSDLYGLSSLSGTPTTIVGCVTRALAQKSDAGTRNIQTQLKSGGTTSSGTSTALNTTFGWIYQTNLTDPNTGSAWTATGVNNALIGQVVTA